MKNEDKIVEILSEPKLARFRQIVIQCQGVAAFREPDIAGELKLTAQQRGQCGDQVVEVTDLRLEPDEREGQRHLLLAVDAVSGDHEDSRTRGPAFADSGLRVHDSRLTRDERSRRASEGARAGNCRGPGRVPRWSATS